MSDLTPCNRCTLEFIEHRAKARGATVRTFRNEWGWVSAQYSDESEAKTHFLELPDKCCC